MRRWSGADRYEPLAFHEGALREGRQSRMRGVYSGMRRWSGARFALMSDVQVQAAVHSLVTQVLWSAFALAVVFGAVAQRTHFCTMGAVSDAFTMGDWSRL